VLSGLFARQCHAIAAQRIRRSAQIVALYGNLGYDRHLLQKVVERFGNAFARRIRDRPLHLLWGLVLFSWDRDKISDEEIARVANEISHIRLDSDGKFNSDDNHLDQWERMINKGHLTVWRKPVPNSYLYEYKVYGSYNDIPARAFFFAQVDLEFRKQWDKLVIKLDVIDTDEKSDTEVVHWVMHFPYPMYSRDYVYTRRCTVDNERKLMVIVNRSVNHPNAPITSQYVRVETYMSQMVIRPHSSFDEDGFDYVLTYYDDPKAAFPSIAYNWMATTGVPDFVNKVHNAAKILHESRKSSQSSSDIEEEGVGGEDRIPM